MGLPLYFYFEKDRVWSDPSAVTIVDIVDISFHYSDCNLKNIFSVKVHGLSSKTALEAIELCVFRRQSELRMKIFAQ